MKKILLSLAALALVVCLFACKNPANGTKPYLKGQGVVAKENIVFDSTTFAKTREIVVIPAGQTATIVGSDENWQAYYAGEEAILKGVFIANRKIKLSPFAMSAYEVTQELYSAVMGNNPSVFNGESGKEADLEETQELRPVEYVSWCDCAAFCNELTKKVFGDDTTECAFYRDENFTEPYTKTSADSDLSAYMDITKKGYRLPTEAEWEFAARGGNPTKSEWFYAYAGVGTDNFSPMDESIAEHAWHNFNSNDKTHEVGLKKPNTLGLYDMCGNIQEWCYDRHNANPAQSDDAYTVKSFVVNPLGSASGYERLLRGGCYKENPMPGSVSSRNSTSFSFKNSPIGFRLVRSL